MPTVRVRLPARSQSYEIQIGAGLLRTLGRELRTHLGPSVRRVALISNTQVFELYGRSAIESLRASELTVNHLLIGNSEREKSFRGLEAAATFLHQCRLERNDAVVALGGGVVGDLAGFAAAIYLRGVRLVQVPTSLLAQIDSSVGGKTGINLPSGKNLIGAFHQPSLVLIDPETLRTLPRRELTSGWCEAIKQGAIASRKLFDQTVRVLRNDGKHTDELSATIAAHCRFKASIVKGDERENASRTDHRSRRILNFGHTTAHALEAVTGYKRFRHGEAVGYGVLVAAEISKSLGMLPSRELESIGEAVALSGPLPPASDLSAKALIKAMAADKKAVAGNVQWVLLERIGRARIVDGAEIEPRVFRAALSTVLKTKA